MKKETKSVSLILRIFPSIKIALEKAMEKEKYKISRNEAIRRGIRMYIDDMASRTKRGTK